MKPNLIIFFNINIALNIVFINGNPHPQEDPILIQTTTPPTEPQEDPIVIQSMPQTEDSESK